jgi:anaerobic selenocysteine-containing dehydrogenase
MVGVRGTGADAVNHGRLGPKGLYGSWPWASSPDRLSRPLIREGGALREASWDKAMSRVVAESRRVLDEKGPLGIGFYTSGQLFLEEYYTLAVLGKAGLGTPHMDGNTRLCAATAGEAMKESFGCDGQPGSYTDIGHTGAIFLYGHNMPETQTVLWARILDRTRSKDPPVIVCVDPRITDVAREAARTGGVHLAPRPGTNQALMNGMVRELLDRGYHDRAWVDAHTVGLETLRRVVEPYRPEEVERLCGVPADDVRRAVEIFGTSERVLSTVLRGYYQSHQATAAACQVNNLHLLRGLIGRPGCGILQMSGQPTAQNTRETGADGDLAGFRNWDNPGHAEQLARLWNVDAKVIPHWAPPTHAMQIFRYAEQGSIALLWISATNPAVSLPDLARVRRVLESDACFVVVQDAFLTETARLADVVLPAAGWGEKTGTYTNLNRTVHLSDKAVEPPGEAKSDFEIFLMYADAMDFRDKDGGRLIRWRTAGGPAADELDGARAGGPGGPRRAARGGEGLRDPGDEDDDMADHAPEGGVAAGPARRPLSLPGRALEAVRREAGATGPALAVYAPWSRPSRSRSLGSSASCCTSRGSSRACAPTIMVIAETPAQPAPHPRPATSWSSCCRCCS